MALPYCTALEEHMQPWRAVPLIAGTSLCPRIRAKCSLELPFRDGPPMLIDWRLRISKGTKLQFCFWHKALCM